MRLVICTVLACAVAILSMWPASTRSAQVQVWDNPMPFNVATIKRGRQFYTIHCVTCHGIDGRGDTEMREFLKTSPADLTDEIWIYGGHDRALFDAIKSGREERDMPGFKDKLKDEDIWQVVTYLRYLGGIRP